MVWEQVTRDDFFEGSEVPFVSLSSSHFTFNTAFVRQADINPTSRVSMFIDSANRRIGFEFHEDERPNSFRLIVHHAMKDGKRKALLCSSVGTVRKYKWIEAVTKENPKRRRFTPKKEAGKWVIQLCPAFEERKARESQDIPSDHQGIYRYLREGSKIVYIGRGSVKDRLQSPDRKDWDFDTIEYSMVDNPDEQVRWEDFWIEQFKKENDGKLPFYNKISGSSKIKKG